MSTQFWPKAVFVTAFLGKSFLLVRTNAMYGASAYVSTLEWNTKSRVYCKKKWVSRRVGS